MNDDDLNLDSLLVFALVVREGSLSGASQKLGRTKQSVHRQIKSLETSMSVRLFEKVKRNIVPSKRGLTLYRHAEKILDERRAIYEYLNKPIDAAPATLRVSAPPLLAEVFLNSAMNSFMAANPNIGFECLLSNDLLHLEDNDIDIAVRIGKLGEVDQENFKVLSIGEASRLMIASPKYIQKHGMPANVQELKNHRILHFGMLNEVKRVSWRLSRSIDLSPVLSASSPRLVLDLALNGQGIAMLPEMLCAHELKRKKLIEVLPASRISNIPISVCLRNRFSDNSIVSDFVARIQEAAKSSEYWLKQC